MSFPADWSLWSPSQAAVRAMSSSAGPSCPYSTLAVSHPAEFVTHVELHRPDKRNAMNKAFWRQDYFSTWLCLFFYLSDMTMHDFALFIFVFVPFWQVLSKCRVLYFEANNLKICFAQIKWCSWVECCFFSFREMVELFNELAGNPDCRVVVFSGAGKMFTAGRSQSSPWSL